MSVAEFFANMAYGPAPEGAGPALKWIDAHDGQFGLFINNEMVPSAAGERFATINPATDEKLAEISQAGASDIDEAVAAARAAQPGWLKRGGHGRARVLYAVSRVIQKHARLLAVLETLDNGKPIRETRDLDVLLAARHFLHHAGWAQIMDDVFANHEPHGVAGQVIPWNFPLLMLAWKVAPALATGNTVVLKPAEYTSLTALLFAELCRDAGVPPGVFNVVTGDGRTGALLTEHDDVDKVAFTGSTEVGRLIREKTAGSGKALTLELGGKSPFIVFDDADLDGAVEGVVDAIWFNQGQVCCAGSRLLVQEPVAQAMIAKLRARMETLRVGDPLDKAVDIGAIVAPEQLQRIEQLVAQGIAEGATLWQPAWDKPAAGNFFPPSLFTDVAPAATIAHEEIFGPVLASMTFRTPQEAVSLANNSRYGLAASVWSEDINVALDIAPQLKCGVVWVNSTNMFDAACGFGGYRESGYGREGGKEGMYAYLKPRYLRKLKADVAVTPPDRGARPDGVLPIDRTAKMYIGGKQSRPDSGYSRMVIGANGTPLAEVGEGNRKDVRNAVEAASKAGSWSRTTSHLRAQILYYIAENLEARRDEFAARLGAMTGAGKRAGAREVTAAVKRLFSAAAWADKYDSAVHTPPLRGVALAMNEPLGTMAIVCPDRSPLLALISLVAPAVAMGNRVVVVPSEAYPLAATDLYQVFDTSDVPAGVINMVTGDRAELTRALAAHDDVSALWLFGDGALCAEAERLSVGNLKQTWVSNGKGRDWADDAVGEGEEFLRRATQVKNIWIPYGA